MRINPPTPPVCDECGSDPIHHRSTYATVAIDGVLSRLIFDIGLRHTFVQRMRRLENIFLPAFYSLAENLGFGEFLYEPDDKTILLAQMLWDEAKKRGIVMREFRLFGLPRNMFVAALPDGRTISFEGFPFPDYAGGNPPWLNNKAELKKKLCARGFPVAPGGAACTKNGALNIFRRLTHPVIVKPHVGSASRHTILHIADEKALVRAFAVAKRVSPFVVIEEELEGLVYRATVVGGRLVAVLRRDPPHIVGDGARTIEELVAAANTHPERQGPYFSHIKFSPDAAEELSLQGMTPKSIPRKGERVTFHQKVNWSLGGTTADVTDGVHPDNAKLFEDIAAMLKTPLVGIDFIIRDISRSWKETPRSGVIECNDMPFFDNHHLPFEGKPRNVAGAIWDLVLG